MKNRNKKILSICIAATIISGNVLFKEVAAYGSDMNECIAPHEAEYGYFVDEYKNNNSDNITKKTNPSIGLLSKFLELWTPGTEWNNGSKVNKEILDNNIEKSKNISSARTKAEEDAAYLDDRRNQSYSTISGLGEYSDEFIKGSNAGTTIPDTIPDDSNTVLYDDKGNSNGVWADEDSDYGNIVKLVNTVRGEGSSTSSSKKFYKYMRPFRWDNGSTIQDSLIPAIKSDPSNDGGFPSGHTNASYLTSLGLAYSVPEKYDELLTRASELGNNRIVCGMHSCLDVIGGRVHATAVAASALNNKDNKELKKKAVDDGECLLSQKVNGKDDYDNYQKNKEKYIERLTYGFAQTGDTTKEMRVPKGAEVLLESRLPYLDDTDRRYVLYTTGLESGYPVLDDEEGWGRLNLFAASNGYGSFINDVTVTMDASKGGFNAKDTWKNDIDGTGSLTKNGTGILCLSGNNTYTGGTRINGGTIEIDNSTSAGNGDVVNNSTLSEDYKGKVEIEGSYEQNSMSTVVLNISSDQDVLDIKGRADLDGHLIINFNDGYVPSSDFTLINYSSSSNSKFDDVTINGLKNSTNKEVKYTDNAVILTDK